MAKRTQKIKARAAGYEAGNYQSTSFRKQINLVQTAPKSEDHLVGPHDRARMRGKSKELWRNTSIVKAFVDRLQDLAIKDGFDLQFKTGNAQWNRDAEFFIKNWMQVADYRQRQNLWEMFRVALAARFLDGDCGFIIRDNGQLTPVESERIVSPAEYTGKNTIVEGVEITSEGIPVAYWIADRGSDGFVDLKKIKRIPAKDFVFLANQSIRFDAVRGVPEFANVTPLLADLTEWSQAYLQKAKNDASYFTVFTAPDASENIGGMNFDQPTEGSAQPKQILETIEPGQNLHLNQGEKVEQFAVSTPGTSYTPYMETKLTELCAGVGLPKAFLMGEWEGLSFSASRGLWISGHRKIKTLQWWLSKFVKTIVVWRIAKAIKMGDLPPVEKDGVSEHWKVEIIPPSIESLDPHKQVIADSAEFLLGKTSLFEICKREGKDLEEVLEQKAKDIIYAKRLANEINATVDDGFKVNWTDLIGYGKQLTSKEVEVKTENDLPEETQLEEKDEQI